MPYSMHLKLNHTSTYMKDMGDFSFQLPMQQDKMEKQSRQQKREELQREVAMLENMLNSEETVRQILQHVYDRKDATTLSIPNSLPPKVKELLAELAMVEDEIYRLESQIQDLQKDVKREQDATKDTKSRQLTINQRNGGDVMSHQYQPPRHPPSSLLSSPLIALNSINIKNNSNNNGEKIGFDTKALHFINKAINGDYNLSLKTGFTDHHDHRHQRLPENHLQKEAGLHDRLIKRSGMLRPSASPLRDFRHPTPKPKERNVNVIEPTRKSISSSVSYGSESTEESNKQKMQANRLSESILKCLMLIYVRLIRTWRQVELERSGPISRSMHLSLSFRADHGVSGGEGGGSGGSVGGGGMKEIKQQDPYGIFSNHNEPSIPRDIGPYKNLIVFTSSSLDAKCISSSNSIPLFQRLRGLLNSLQKVDLRSLSDQQKLAFWINMYNACIMHGYLQYGVPSTPRKLLALMNKATFNIGGNIVNAQAIEYYILRNLSLSNSTVNEAGREDEKKAIIRELYGLESSNPNVIFALSCGTRSSPAVRIYTAEGALAELERAKVEYLQASIVVSSTKRIAFPELLIQNMHEFARDMDSLVEWVCNQLPTSGSLRKSMVDCFRTNNSTVVDKIPYDFEFQYLLPM
ncbi:hypothetical protein Ancab_030022 [Ancistrocladus abbreviatus]